MELDIVMHNVHTTSSLLTAKRIVKNGNLLLPIKMQASENMAHVVLRWTFGRPILSAQPTLRMSALSKAKPVALIKTVAIMPQGNATMVFVIKMVVIPTLIALATLLSMARDPALTLIQP